LNFADHQQVIVLSRKSRSRVRLRNIDRLILVWELLADLLGKDPSLAALGVLFQTRKLRSHWTF
jgi:hypothetical protein